MTPLVSSNVVAGGGAGTPTAMAAAHRRMHRRVRAPRGRSRSGGGSGGVERECGGACSARSRLPAGAARAQCGAPPRPHLGARARLTTTTRAPTHPPRTFASLPRVRASASTSRFPLLSRAMRRIRIPPRCPFRSIKPQAPVKVQTPAEPAPTGRKKNSHALWPFDMRPAGEKKKTQRAKEDGGRIPHFVSPHRV